VFQASTRLGYNKFMAHEHVRSQEFRPALLSRRGEVTAWILTVIASFSLIALRNLDLNIPWTAGAFVGIFLLAAMSISLGNWMDRRTVIRVDPSGLEYRNGLRRVIFLWGEVSEVQIAPSRFGDQVHVIGDHAHFRFRRHADIEYQGKVRGHMGFPDGHEILKIILDQNSLSLREGEAPRQYYSRG
jgi:hypothetical protein